MSLYIREIMNRELFSVRPDAQRDDVLASLLELGISAAPVLDGEERPIGMTSLRDLLRGEPFVSKPVRTITMNVDVEHAACAMIDAGTHHLVVVGSDGRAVGMVSSLDLLRALVGRPSAHPPAFPHRDAELDVTWSDPQPLDTEHADGAPDAAGVLVLSFGGVGRPEHDIWVEPANALRARVSDLLELPQSDDPALTKILTRRDLRYRYATIVDAKKRTDVVRRLRARLDWADLPPGSR